MVSDTSRRKKKVEWYSISLLGKLVAVTYIFIPGFIVYADTAGILTSGARMGAIGGMLFITGCASVAKKNGTKLFIHKKHDGRGGFTLIELLVVISIIGILMAIIFPAFRSARNQAYFSRSKAEMRSISTALELFMNKNGGGYPADANRDLPAGLDAYLSGGNWPKAPFPDSVYDWDNWAPGDLTYAPQSQVYQISIRFCTSQTPLICNFPTEPWAQNFDYYSAVYYCISGPCRSHSSQPVSHPGLCVNC